MPKFQLGQVVGTPAALDALNKNQEYPITFLRKHINGDWGIVSDDDKKANEDALKDGDRLFSAYMLKDGKTKIWIITESDRSATTILLPDDY